MVKIKFLGAAGTVTGSMYLFDVDGRKFLLEAGMFQREQEIEERNYNEFPFDPSEVEYIIITHGHLDHIGLAPNWLQKDLMGK